MLMEIPTGPEHERLLYARPLWWTRGQARYEHGSIVLEGGKTTILTPQDGRLAVAFAGIRKPGDAVQFASSYGLLAHSEEQREPFTEWLYEAVAISGVIDIAVALRAFERGDPRPLESLANSPILLHGWAETPITMRHDYPGKQEWGAGPPIDVQARFAIDKLTNQGLRDVHLGVHPGESRKHRRGTTSFIGTVYLETLKQVIYYDLWLLLTSPQEARLCQQCGKAFIIHDQRQEYCTPACANRARYLRRKRQQIDTGPSDEYPG
jgi:hypothetical protein